VAGVPPATFCDHKKFIKSFLDSLLTKKIILHNVLK